ncbi:MAG: hypothetical protein JOZ70_02485 [Pseudolabrys sp.]|nr:hypothetical protein [Pseudolabrys sp.]
MPKYFFHLRDKESLKDSFGVDLPGIAEARAHAESVAKELMFKRQGMLDSDWTKWTMTVEDPAGTELFSLKMSDLPSEKDDD